MIDRMTSIETALAGVGESLSGLARELEVRTHLHSWHPISTAPYNQNLEVQITQAGEPFDVPFPCRLLNSGEWINSDLGLRVQIDPTFWRAWSYRDPAVDHPSQVNEADHQALLHTHGPICRRTDNTD